MVNLLNFSKVWMKWVHWHVSFNMDPLTQGTWEISGFDKGLPPDMPKVPMWVKQNGSWWSTGKL